MKKVLDIVGFALLFIIGYYVIQFFMVVGGVDINDAPGMTLFSILSMGGLWLILDKPYKKYISSDENHSQKDIAEAKPYKIESGYTPGVDGGYYYREYKTKKDYEFSQIFPWIVILIWIVLGYLAST